MELKCLQSALGVPYHTMWTSNIQKHLSDRVFLTVIQSRLTGPLAEFSWDVRNVTKSEVERDV